MKKLLATILAFSMLLACVSILAGCTSNGGSYDGKTVKISIDEWIGYQNLLDANGGLTTAPDSINAKNGISIEYVIMNDASASSNALISGELQGAGYTVNRYAFLQSKFNDAGIDVVMPFITNYSNGGDGVIGGVAEIFTGSAVAMDIDESGHYHIALHINDFIGIWQFIAGSENAFDLFAFNQDRGIIEIHIG